MAQPEYSFQEWFEAAAEAYVKAHQGCPWCQGANRVYRTERGSATEFHCGGCDFYVRHDRETGQYYMGAGQTEMAPATMHAV